MQGAGNSFPTWKEAHSPTDHAPRPSGLGMHGGVSSAVWLHSLEIFLNIAMLTLVTWAKPASLPQPFTERSPPRQSCFLEAAPTTISEVES